MYYAQLFPKLTGSQEPVEPVLKEPLLEEEEENKTGSKGLCLQQPKNDVIGGQSKTTLTIFCPILTTYLPPVDMITK